MLVVVSPAKRLDWAERNISMSSPEFQGEASRLAGHARQLSLGDLRSLMSLSDDLARLNRDRFRAEGLCRRHAGRDGQSQRRAGGRLPDRAGRGPDGRISVIAIQGCCGIYRDPRCVVVHAARAVRP